MLYSFNWAIEGIVWALRHERSMRIHVAAAVIVVVLGLVFSVSRVELLLILAAITFVMVAELINTAVEKIIDLFAEGVSEPAKIAKDVAAGAVLVASINALAVGYLVFYDNLVS
ncbi:MAG: diacylglycerol kinase, partial [Actinobacteria bacterium]|nr:diacylglycerol kinase [Actinomycetota bacterium]